MSSPPLSASKQLRLRSTSTSSHLSTYSDDTTVSTSQPFLTRLGKDIDSAFHQLGLLLSTHQIPSLLLCALVICSLLTPTLLLYFESATPTSPTFFTASHTPQLPWDAEGLQRQGLIKSEDQVCWDRLTAYYAHREIGARVVVVEQLLVSSAGGGRGGWRGGGALTKSTLHRAMLVQRELERRLLAGDVEGLGCIRDAGGRRCAVASPAEWWESEAMLINDDDVHATLSLPPSTRRTGSRPVEVPLTSSNTLVGIGRDRQGTVKGAHHLAITFYLTASSTTGNSSSVAEVSSPARLRATWRRAVRDVVDGTGSWREANTMQRMEKMGKVTEGRGRARRVILKHLPHLRPASHPRALEGSFFLLGYLTVALYVRSSLRSLGPHVVHSMVGLILTGVVQLLLSGVMSLSVCKIVGWDIGLVPWNLLGFLVLVCGVDNMLVLTNAVSLTDIRLPIPQRLAAGLSAVGLSTAVTLVAELVGTSVLFALIDVQVIRQWIVFTAIVLVVDFFLEMTFFATILSIDIQRLELADLLQPGFGHRQMPSTPSDLDDSESLHSLDEPQQSAGHHLQSLFTATKTVLRDRAARTTTFGFLFLINILLLSVYGPDHYLPAFCSETALAPHNRPFLSPSLSSEISRSLQRGQRTGNVPSVAYPADQILPGAAEAFWRVLNPHNASTAVHLLVEPVTVLQFFDDGLLAAPESVLAGSKGHTQAIVEVSAWSRAVTVLLPIAATMGVLYLLLLYLLKDAELLENERERGVKERAERRKAREGAGVDAVRLKGGWRGDVELLASGREAVVSWAGLDDQIILWRRSKTSSTSSSAFDPPTALEIPLAADPPSLTLLALDSSSRFCAAATTAGRILVWSLERKLLIDFNPSGAVESERFKWGAPVALFAGPASGRKWEKKGGGVAPPGLGRESTEEGKSKEKEEAMFVAVHQNGVAVMYDCIACSSAVVFRPSTLATASPLALTLAHSSSSPSSTPPPSPGPPGPRTKLSIILPFSPPSPRSSPPFWPVYARHSSTGQLALHRPDPAAPQTTWAPFFDEEVTTPSDPITALACGEVELGSAEGPLRRGILVVGTLSGLISLYSLPLAHTSDDPSETLSSHTVTRLCTLTELDGPVRQLRLALAPTARQRSSTGSPSSLTGAEKCPSCAQPLNDGFVVVASSRTSIQVLRVSLAAAGIGAGCACLVGSRSSSTSASRATPKKSRRASHGRVVNGSSGDKAPSPRTALSEVEGVEGSPVVRTPPTPTFKIDEPAPLTEHAEAATVPLFDISAEPSPVVDRFSPASTLVSSPTHEPLQIHEVLNTFTDERGGWEVVGDKLVGVRRHRASLEEVAAWKEKGESRASGSSRWEVWSAGLGMGSAVGESELERLLRTAGTVDQATSAFPFDGSSSSATAGGSQLRRRNVILTAPARHPLQPSPSTSLPSIRFQDVDLPFSRARPLVSALGGSAIAVGLGNQLVLVSQRQASGRVGAVGGRLLALPRRRRE